MRPREKWCGLNQRVKVYRIEVFVTVCVTSLAETQTWRMKGDCEVQVWQFLEAAEPFRTSRGWDRCTMMYNSVHNWSEFYEYIYGLRRISRPGASQTAASALQGIPYYSLVKINSTVAFKPCISIRSIGFCLVLFRVVCRVVSFCLMVWCYDTVSVYNKATRQKVSKWQASRSFTRPPCWWRQNDVTVWTYVTYPNSSTNTEALTGLDTWKFWQEDFRSTCIQCIQCIKCIQRIRSSGWWDAVITFYKVRLRFACLARDMDIMDIFTELQMRFKCYRNEHLNISLKSS